MIEVLLLDFGSRYEVFALFGRFADASKRTNRQDSYWDAGAIWMFAGACLLLLVISAIAPKLHASWLRARLNSSNVLFRQLCRAHKLSRHSSRLLNDLANARQLAHPALLFVEPHHFERQSLPAALSQQADELLRLREQLFEATESQSGDKA